MKSIPLVLLVGLAIVASTPGCMAPERSDADSGGVCHTGVTLGTAFENCDRACVEASCCDALVFDLKTAPDSVPNFTACASDFRCCSGAAGTGGSAGVESGASGGTAGVAGAASGGSGTVEGGTTVTIHDVDDATIKSEWPDANDGVATTLSTWGYMLSTHETLVKPNHLFDYFPTSSTIVKATLCLHATVLGGPTSVRLALVPWWEPNVTWSNRPTTGGKLATLSVITSDPCVDITSVAQGWFDGDPVYGIVLTSEGGGIDSYSEFRSQESGQGPTFLVTYK